MTQLPGQRLRSAIKRVTESCSEIPYECDEETFVCWQAAGEEILLCGSDSALRMRARYRVVIFSRADYELLKIKLYASLLTAGFELAAMPGEIYSDTTRRRQWPIDVETTYDLVDALDAIAGPDDKEET